MATFGKSKVGIYSSKHMWQTLFGASSWVNAGDETFPLWYAHYDLKADFSGFMGFSSWPTTPSAHQFTGTVTVCGHGVDTNWAPSGFAAAAAAAACLLYTSPSPRD